MQKTNRTRNKTTWTTASAIALSLCCSPGLSAGPADDTLDLLEQENKVFAASRYAQTIAETPANVTVLTREDIKRFGWRTINDALTSLPGIYNAASQWPALGVRGTAVPGDFGSRLLFMVNGMPIYEPSYGGFFLEYLDIEAIDRIELVKGTGSALYGSGAVLGVVNLITQTGRNAPGISIALAAESFRTGKLHAANGHLTSSGIDTYATASLTDSRGREIYFSEFDHAAFANDQYGGRTRGNDKSRTLRLFGRAARNDLWLQWLLIHGDKRDPTASYGTVFTDDRLRLRERLAALEGGYTFSLAGGALLTSRLYAFAVTERGDYPYSNTGRLPPADYLNVTDIASRQVGGEVRYDRYFTDSHHVLAGLEIKYVRSRQQIGDQPGLTRAGVVGVERRPSYGQWAAFVQDEVRIGRDRLFLGARYDSYENFSDGVRSHWSPRVAYVHEVTPKTTAKLIYGEAYRAPTLYEAHFQDGAPDAAATLWMNPQLRPEIARSLEALLEQRPSSAIEWSASVFLTRLKDTPVQVVTPQVDGVDCLLGPDSCTQYRNSGTTQQVIGTEWAARLRPSDRRNLYASVVLQRGTDDGRRLPSSPRTLAKAGISETLPWWRLSAALEAWWVSRAEGRVNSDGSRTAAAPSYLLVNTNLHATLAGWRLSLRVNNLLNRRYYTVASRELQPLERIPAAPRALSLHVQRTF
jgi:iron complex outermembrane receptor protein